MHRLNNLHKKIIKYVAVDICWLHSMSVVLHWLTLSFWATDYIEKGKKSSSGVC